MGVCYWGDKFYGIDRLTNAELFDENKEREVILKSLKDNECDIYKNYLEEERVNFESISIYDADNGIDDYINFLEDTDVMCFAADSWDKDVLFFGIDYSLPWQMTALKSQDEVDQDIYNAIKPILKDGICLDTIKPRIQAYSINGQDDYISYYSMGK